MRTRESTDEVATTSMLFQQPTWKQNVFENNKLVPIVRVQDFSHPPRPTSPSQILQVLRLEADHYINSEKRAWELLHISDSNILLVSDLLHRLDPLGQKISSSLLRYLAAHQATEHPHSV
jgi:hypothetical protein